MANSRYSTFLLASSPRFPPAAHSIFTRERTHPSININRRSHSEALSVQLVYGHLSDFPIRDDDSYKKKKQAATSTNDPVFQFGYYARLDLFIYIHQVSGDCRRALIKRIKTLTD